MRYARVENGEVKEIINFNPAGRYHPDVEAQFIPCDETVQHRYRHNNNVFLPPLPHNEVPNKSKADKLILKLIEKGILTEGDVE